MNEKHGAKVDYSEARNPNFVQFHLVNCNFQKKFNIEIPNGQIVYEVE
jgi:hypothetical protein